VVILNRAIINSLVSRKFVALVEEQLGYPLNGETRESITFALSHFLHKNPVIEVSSEVLSQENQVADKEDLRFSKLIFENICKAGGSPVLFKEFPDPLFMDRKTCAILYSFDLNKVLP
jgi:hypothetical protein